MKTNWAPIIGEYEENGNGIVFKGGMSEFQGGSQVAIGNFLSQHTFAGGKLSVDVEFSAIDQYSACEVIIYYDPNTRAFVTAGIGSSGVFYTIRDFKTQWVIRRASGERKNLKAKKKYHIEVNLIGSKVTLVVDGVVVEETLLPYQLPQSQVGIWCMSKSDISISNFNVSSDKPKAFVVMQFTTPYNELYKEVINPICLAYGIDATRADEVYGPGVIIADIIKQIIEAKLIIADISPKNPNVYYEIGYAHAFLKPTILIAEKNTELPFDVSPFRVLFYENTILGKKKIEDGLKRHLNSILIKDPLSER